MISQKLNPVSDQNRFITSLSRQGTKVVNPIKLSVIELTTIYDRRITIAETRHAVETRHALSLQHVFNQLADWRVA